MSPSPTQNLQGASRITGGFTRGRALGNVFNQADLPDMMEDDTFSLVREGKVYLFESSEGTGVNVATDSKRTVKVNVFPTLCPVLEKIAIKYSPIKSKLSIFVNPTLKP